MEPTHIVVTEQHRSEYPEPITFDEGAPLCIGERSSGNKGWENWYFCSTPGQKDGWVPKQIIEWTSNTSFRKMKRKA